MKHRVIVAVVGIVALAVTVVLAVASASRSSQLEGVRGTVWVVNKPLNNVAAYDAATGSIRAVVPVGKDPNSVVVAPGSNKAYVTNEVSNDVTVVSTMTFQVVGTIPVPLRPHHIRTSRDGSRVYVSEYSTNKIAVIDTAADKVVQELTAVDHAGAFTHSMWISRDRSRIWAANEGANQITELDAATGAIHWAVSVGQRPSEVVVTPDNRTAYVTVRTAENKVKRLDVASHAVTAELDMPNQPDTIQLSPDRKTLTVALRGTPAQLSVIDTTTMTVTKTIDLAEPSTIAGHNWLSANGRYSFVAFEGGHSPGVAVVDHRTNSVVAIWEYPGGGRPHGIFFDDPAATEGPAVAIAPGAARVSPARTVTLRLACSANAVGFCHGRVLVAGGRKSFALSAGIAANVRTVIPEAFANRLAAARRALVRIQAVATDQLGNTRTSVRAVRLIASR